MPTSQEQQPSFGEVKASASKNIGQLLQDLQSFEHAIETEMWLKFIALSRKTA